MPFPRLNEAVKNIKRAKQSELLHLGNCANLMAPRRIYYTSDFKKAYKRLPRNIQDTIDRKDKIFRENPFDPSLRTHKLHGPIGGLWSFWATRNYRVLFEFVKDDAIFY